MSKTGLLGGTRLLRRAARSGLCRHSHSMSIRLARCSGGELVVHTRQFVHGVLFHH
jgi:hypothetical protein